MSNTNMPIYLVNTGHGNCCLIVAGTTLVVFDCGSVENINSNLARTFFDVASKNVLESCKAIRKKYAINSVIFIRSHIHHDHHNLFKTVETVFSKKYIAKITMDLNYKGGSVADGYYEMDSQKSVSLYQVLRKLDSTQAWDIILKKIMVYPNDKSNEPERAHQENDTGLMLLITRVNNKKNETVIFAGDMSYERWFGNVTDSTRLQYILNAKHISVPHHYKHTRTLANMAVDPQATLYVFCSDRCTPNAAHKSFINQVASNNKIVYTDAGNTYIEI